MKTNKYYIVAFFTLLSLSACQKDEPRVNFNLRVADHYDSGDSKVWMNGQTPVFVEDEAVRINGETYLIDHRNGSPAVYDVVEADKYYAIYPASWVGGSASASPSITFPDMQKWQTDASGHQIVENPMVAFATSDGATLNFYNVAALATVHITNHYLSGIKIKYVALYADDIDKGGAYLSGNGTITGINTSTPSVSVTSGITNVSIDCSSMGSLSYNDEVDITLALPPITNVKLWVDVYMEDGSKNKYSFTKVTTHGKTIGRNQMGSINVELSTSGDDPVNACGLFWGTGTSEDDPYIIMDTADLKKLKAEVASGRTTYNNSDIYYLQTANIDLSEETRWLPGIGTPSYAFVANYDGSEATVTLNCGDINTYNSGFTVYNGVGLFGNVGGGGKIKNLRTKGSIASQNRNVYVGAIAGKVVGKFTFENCKSQVNLSSSNYYLGGICGYVNADGQGVVFDKCEYSGSFNRSSAGIFGGICGCVRKGTVSFTKCSNSGTVSGTTSDQDSIATGGICGVVLSTATKVSFDGCSNSGNLNPAGRCVGGICGNIKSPTDITNCKNDGEIRGKYNIGGIVGIIEGTPTKISKCKNNNTVTSTYGGADNIGVGGIIGKATKGCEIKMCKNTATINVSSGGGKINAGGILGVMYGSDGATIFDCGNSGKILVNYAFSAAGIVGQTRSGTNTIINCYNIGNIEVTTGTTSYVGGIATTGNSITTTITNCYFSGNYVKTNNGSSNYRGDIGSWQSGGFSSEYTYSLNSFNSTNNYLHANFSVTINATTLEYETNNSSQKLKAALNAWRTGDNASYSAWVSTDDTKLPYLAWEDE